MNWIQNRLNKTTKFAFIYKMLLIFSLAMISSCTKDVLNMTPLDRLSDDAVWQDGNLMQTWINNTYRVMPQGHTNGAQMIANVSDESYYRTGRPNYITAGNITPTTLRVLDFWTQGGEARTDFGYWQVITKCNIFLEKVGSSPLALTLKDRIPG